MKAGFTVFCVSLIGIMLMFVSQSNAIEPGTVMGMWLFDTEGDMAIDSSGNGLDGTIVNTVNRVDGKFGMALEFGADGYVDCGNQAALNVGTNNFSITAWIKYSGTPADWHANIVEKVDFAAPRHGYLLCVRGGLDAGNMEKPLMWFGLGDASGIHMFGTDPINDGEWHHLAATIDRQGMMLMYRDGNLEVQLDISDKADQNEDNQSSFMIGGEAGTRTLEGGLVDEVALFNVILTEGDINDIVQNGLSILTAVSPEDRLATVWGEVKRGG